MNYKEFDGDFKAVVELVKDVAKNDLGEEVSPEIISYVIESVYGPINGLIMSTMINMGFNGEALKYMKQS